MKGWAYFMALHLIKMAAGISSLEELEERQNYLRFGSGASKRKQPKDLIHVTRFFPKRADEILLSDNKVPGSLFWVFQKRIQARQKIAEFREIKAEGGTTKCGIVLEGPLVHVQPLPKKAFQGWRYLPIEDTPLDIKQGASITKDISPQMRAELTELCLI